MDPFAKRKVKTQAEKDALICEARANFQKCGPMSFLISGTQEDFVQAVADNIEVEGEKSFVPLAPLSTSEQADFEIRLTQNTTFDRIFANRRTDTASLPPILQKVADEEEAAEMREFLKPARDQETALSKVIEEAVARAFLKVSGATSDNRTTLMPKPTPGREGIMPLVRAAVEENPGSDAARFLTAFASGDEAGMRRLVRELVAA